MTETSYVKLLFDIFIIAVFNSSYGTFSYNVSMVFLNTYDPVCPIGINLVMFDAQHLCFDSYMSHSITVFPEGSFIRDLCLIRDDYTVLITVQLQKKSWLFKLTICVPLSTTTCLSSISFLQIIF